MKISDTDFDIMIKALKAPPSPNDTLKKAYEEYKKVIADNIPLGVIIYTKA